MHPATGLQIFTLRKPVGQKVRSGELVVGNRNGAMRAGRGGCVGGGAGLGEKEWALA